MRDENAEYTAFLSGISLLNIALVHSSFRISRNEYLQQDETTMSMSLSCEPIASSEDHFDLAATMRMRMLSADGKQTFVKLYAKYNLHFHAPKPQRKHISQFANSEVRFIIWPYLREYVGNTSARMHVPPILLPFSSRATDL